ncbi:MAG: prolyl oligopeptidase family serine peptidase [Bacteroidales bacterium]|jgi:hypothetical protein|nr:prolyl oligopeptidase family serine peptidase [Bacteroidales bacterium]
MKFWMLFTIPISFFLVNCSSNNNINNVLKNNTQNISDSISEEITKKIISDTTIFFIFNNLYTVAIDIKYPQSECKGNILLLHGWNCYKDEICQNTDFCDQAINKGYILIIPNLGKTNYISSIYPQTHKNLQIYPTLTWIIDTMITNLQNNFSLFLQNQNNFIAGISTGARGATMLAYHLPEIFKAVATISGEFDITSRPDYYLYYAYLGQLENFPERWKKECFAFDCEHYLVPTYIGHGENDNTAPVQNSLDMYDSLRFYHSDIKFILNIVPNASHNYKYWKTETKNIITFFNEII